MLCRACSRRETRGLPRRTGLVLTGFFLAAADFMNLISPLDPLIACHNRRRTTYKNRSLVPKSRCGRKKTREIRFACLNLSLVILTQLAIALSIVTSHGHVVRGVSEWM